MSQKINSSYSTDERTGMNTVVTIVLGLSLVGGGAVYRLHLFDRPVPQPVQLVVHRDIPSQPLYPSEPVYRSERESDTRRALRSPVPHLAPRVADHALNRLFSRHVRGSVTEAKRSKPESRHSSRP